MWGKFGLGAINGLHKTGVSPQAGHPHWYATQVSCFWTHSIHCHFYSNYNCNLGLLNDLWTMLNERTVISLLWWEESLGTDFPPPPTCDRYYSSMSIFSLFCPLSPSCLLIFSPRTNILAGTTGIRRENLCGISGSEVIRAKLSQHKVIGDEMTGPPLFCSHLKRPIKVFSCLTLLFQALDCKEFRLSIQQ